MDNEEAWLIEGFVLYSDYLYAVINNRLCIFTLNGDTPVKAADKPTTT